MSQFNVILVILSIVGFLLVIFGLQRPSQITIFFGSITFLTPLFYFIGWTVVCPFVPGLALIISSLGKRKSAN